MRSQFCLATLCGLLLAVFPLCLHGQGSGVRHVGPTAQDFRAAFELGQDDKTIPTVDADGVALAAIQGLNQKLTEELKRRDAENTGLKERLERLEKLLTTESGKN